MTVSNSGAIEQEIWRELERLGFAVKNWSDFAIMRELRARGVVVESKVIYGVRRLSFKLGTRQQTWRAGRSRLNSPLVRQIARNKSATSALLRGRGLPATENAIFDPTEGDRAWNWASKFESAVVKPNDGLQGKNVFVSLIGKVEFLQAFEHVAERTGKPVLVEEHITGDQYRCLIVGGKLTGVLKLIPANVVGSGEHSIATLIERKNSTRRGIHQPLHAGKEATQTLQTQNMDLESVPVIGHRVLLARTTNVATGGDVISVGSVALSGEEVSILEAVAKALPGGGLLGVDIIKPADSQADAMRILEVNTRPQISMHHFPLEGPSQDVASAIIDYMAGDSRSL